MKKEELLGIRLYNQLLRGRRLKTPQEVVAWMGAMQAQTFDMAKWAIGSRLESATVKDIDEALDTGKIVRTHILRPTWHFVSSEDIHWMYTLSTPRLRPVYRSYAKANGADEELLLGTVPLLVKLLEGGKHLTKQEIGENLRAQNVVLDDVHLKLSIFYAEMDGLLVNGRMKGNKQTFTLLDEWVPRKKVIDRDEALECLARKFFTSHGPATLADFVWWSGLTMTDCRKAIGMIGSDFIRETVNGREFWMRGDIQLPPHSRDDEGSALLLAPFDEFVVSYKDRSEMIKESHYGKVMTKNGLFSPTIMWNGEIVGSWKKVVVNKRQPKDSSIGIELSFFEKGSKKRKALFKSEIQRLEMFYTNND